MDLSKLIPFFSCVNAMFGIANNVQKVTKKIINKFENSNAEEPNLEEKIMNIENKPINSVPDLVNTLGGALTGSNAKIAKQKEAELRRQQVEESLIDLSTQRILMGQNVERILQEARRKSITQAEKQALYVKWRIFQQQYDYVNTMYENMMMIQARMQISDMTVEFGEAIKAATDVLKKNNKETPDFSSLMRKFNKQIIPINEMLGSGFDDVSKTLMEVEKSDNDLYGMSRFEAEIRGNHEYQNTSVNEPVFTESKKETEAMKKDDIEDILQQLAKDLGGK